MNWPNSRNGAVGGRPIARAAILLVPLVLAACGSVVAGSGAGSTGPQSAQSPNKAVPLPSPLCRSPGAVNHLVVRRTGVISRAGQQSFAFPALVTVTSAAEASAVASALYPASARPVRSRARRGSGRYSARRCGCTSRSCGGRSPALRAA